MLDELQREACEANRALPRHGLVRMNFGHASAIDRSRGIFAIKPGSVDDLRLRPADMVLIDLEGIRVEGRLRPSSDTPTHREVHLGFPTIGGVAEPVRLAELGFHGPCRVRDLWRQEDLGEFTDEFAPAIAGHGAGLHRVSPRGT